MCWSKHRWHLSIRRAGKIKTRQRLQCEGVWTDPDSGDLSTLINKHTCHARALLWNGFLSEMINLIDWKVQFLHHYSAASCICGVAEGAESSQLLHRPHVVASTGTRKQRTGPESSVCEESVAGGRQGRDEEEAGEQMIKQSPQEDDRRRWKMVKDVFVGVGGRH